MEDKETESKAVEIDGELDTYAQGMRPTFAAFAKEHIWDDDDWDLFLRSKIPEISSEDWTQEDLLRAASFIDFDQPETRRRLKTNAEWEPEIPEDETVIRRFLDLDKFESLLNNEGLWFANIREFPDHFETSFPDPSIDRMQMFADVAKEWGENQVTYAVRRMRVRNKHTYVNCWRMGEGESAVFWNAYVNDGKGVAIETTVGKLRRSVDDEVWEGYIDKLLTDGRIEAEKELAKLMIGKVDYLDYASEPISNSTLSPARFFHKRHGFNDEQEFRLVKSMARLANYEELPEPERGLVLGVDLQQMVDKVILPPNADKSLIETVQGLTDKHLDSKVEKSKLDREPSDVDLSEVGSPDRP